MAGTVSPHRRNAGHALHAGTTVGGRYHLDTILGTGGMGTVFSARHAILGRRVALKVVSSAFIHDPHTTETLLDEARASARASHPNLVQVFDAGIDDVTGNIFLAMEPIEGETLRALLDRRKRLHLREALAIVLPLLDALDAVHASGTIHRDVKPDNVLVTHSADGLLRPTLIDFGVARMIAHAPLHAEDSTSPLGTPAYMSPEQRCAPASVDARADLWSVAVMLYEMLTGTLPDTDQPIDLGRLPTRARPVFARALARDPTQRYPTARALRTALDALRVPPLQRLGILITALSVGGLALAATFTRGRTPTTVAQTPRVPRAAPPSMATPHATAEVSNLQRPTAATATDNHPMASTQPTAPRPSPSPARRLVRPSLRVTASAVQASSSERPWFEPRAGSLRLP